MRVYRFVVITLGVILIGAVLAFAQPLTEDFRLSDGVADNLFGVGVDVSGDLAIVGAWAENDFRGAAFIFRFDGTTWVEEQKLTAGDTHPNQQFGSVVAIEGNVALVAAEGDDDQGRAAGAAYIFRFDGSQWHEEAKLKGTGSFSGDRLGEAAALDGSRVILGSRVAAGKAFATGAAYVFRDDGAGVWSEEAFLIASDGATHDWFGFGVDIDDDVAIIGAPSDDDDGSGSGSAYMFRRVGTSWTEEAKLTTADGKVLDRLGFSVAIDGNRALVGAAADEILVADEGTAYVFELESGVWVEKAELGPSDATGGDGFGFAVSLDGDRAVIGAISHGGGSFTAPGAAYEILFDGSAWNERSKLVASDAAIGDRLGWDVSTSDGRAIAGQGKITVGPGAAYIYELALDPEALIEELVDVMVSVGFPGKGGQAQLNAAISELEESPPDIQGAIDALQDFINFVQAQSGKKIPTATADEMIADAQMIVDLLSQL